MACTAVLGCSPVQDSSRALLLARGGIFTWGSLAQCTSNGERVHYIDHDHFLKYLFEMIREDVAMLVDWGVDYLKYDNCFPRMVFKYHLGRGGCNKSRENPGIVKIGLTPPSRLPYSTDFIFVFVFVYHGKYQS